MKRTLYRVYRKVKTILLTNGKDSAISKAFFVILESLNNLFSERKLTPEQILGRKIWKQIYFLKYGNLSPFVLVSDKPVAIDSDDHKWPRGTLYDNSTNRNFNIKLYYFLNYKFDLKLLDLGCSGGGLVKSILEDGYTAVGLEGSDISKKLRSAEWDTCPYHLFTCDIASPFKLIDNHQEIVKFDVVTAWEVLEHIPEDRLDALIANIKTHLMDGGYFIGSVDMIPDGNLLTGAIYHVTLKPKDWWLAKFEKFGFKEVLNHPFEVEDYLRGNGQGLKDWDPRDGDGFHLILQKNS